MGADVKIELLFLYSSLRTYNLLLHFRFGLYHLLSRPYHRKFGVCWLAMILLRLLRPLVGHLSPCISSDVRSARFTF